MAGNNMKFAVITYGLLASVAMYACYTEVYPDLSNEDVVVVTEGEIKSASGKHDPMRACAAIFKKSKAQNACRKAATHTATKLSNCENPTQPPWAQAECRKKVGNEHDSNLAMEIITMLAENDPPFASGRAIEDDAMDATDACTGAWSTPAVQARCRGVVAIHRANSHRVCHKCHQGMDMAIALAAISASAPPAKKPAAKPAAKKAAKPAAKAAKPAAKKAAAKKAPKAAAKPKGWTCGPFFARAHKQCSSAVHQASTLAKTAFSGTKGRGKAAKKAAKSGMHQAYKTCSSAGKAALKACSTGKSAAKAAMKAAKKKYKSRLLKAKKMVKATVKSIKKNAAKLKAKANQAKAAAKAQAAGLAADAANAAQKMKPAPPAGARPGGGAIIKKMTKVAMAKIAAAKATMQKQTKEMKAAAAKDAANIKNAAKTAAASKLARANAKKAAAKKEAIKQKAKAKAAKAKAGALKNHLKNKAKADKKNAKKALKHVANKAKKAVAKSKAMIDQLETGAAPPAKFLGASAPKLAAAAPKLQNDQFGETSVPKLKLYEMEDVLFQEVLTQDGEQAVGAKDDFLRALHDEEVKKTHSNAKTVGGVVYPAGLAPTHHKKKHDDDTVVPVSHHSHHAVKTPDNSKFAFLPVLPPRRSRRHRRRRSTTSSRQLPITAAHARTSASVSSTRSLGSITLRSTTCAKLATTTAVPATTFAISATS